MFAPPVGVRVAANDQNALVFGQPVGPVPVPPTGLQNTYFGASQLQGVANPHHLIEVSSELTLASMTASWAVENREALVATLRSTLGLTQSENLEITSITAARRLDSIPAEERKLQNTGVKIGFTVGLSSQSRAQQSQASVQALASGNQVLLATLVQTLDAELQSRGAPPVKLSPATVAVRQPVVVRTPQAVASSPQFGMQAQFGLESGGQVESAGSFTNATEKKSKKDADNNTLMGALIIAIAIVFFALHKGGKKVRSAATPPMEQNGNTAYNAKVYASDEQHAFDELR
jgi:hypothetical protein